MDRLNKALGFALVLSFVGMACATPAIPEGDLGEEEESEDGVSTKKPKAPKKNNNPAPAPTNPAPGDPPATPPPTGTNNPPPPPPPPPGGSCTASATYDACISCCDPGGALQAAEQAFETCACGGGQCSASCTANFCGGQQPSAACDTCLTNTCDPAAGAACTSAACQTASQCVETSGCYDKP
jgi:hypothetical protein